MFNRGTTLAGLLLLSLAVVAAPPYPNTGIIVLCGEVEGRWSWSIGGVVTIDGDGAAAWAPTAEGPAMFSGSWECDLNSGQMVITWKHGQVEILRLSPDGKRLEGSNQAGIEVNAQRWSDQPLAPQAGPVPPMLVGTWVREIYLPGPTGAVPVTLHIAADGEYRVDAGPQSHNGSLLAVDGRWEMKAAGGSTLDRGQYQFQNWATLVTGAGNHANAGRWHRRDASLRLGTVDISGQKIPMSLPDRVREVAAVASRWRPDAVLVEAEFERPRRSHGLAKDEIELSFMSPATGAGLVVTLDADGARFFVHDVVRWGDNAIPDGFLDLPAAWSIARQHGLQTPLDRASLRVWQSQGQDPVLAWSISSARGRERGLNLDGVDGTRLQGDLSGYVAAYNAQWAAAAAGLRRLFQQARPAASPTSSFDFGSGSGSGGSSSYDGGGSSSGSSGYGTAAQGAWGAGDMRAYDRIMSGTATGDDCYRYGC